MMGPVRSRARAAVLAGLISAAGCNRESPAPAAAVAAAEPTPAATAPPVALPVAPAVAPVPVAVQTQPPPPPVFPFPNDLSGKELPKVVAPRAPAPLPVEKFGKSPTVRTPPDRVVSPDPLGKLVYTPTPVLPKRPAGFQPYAPAERVPFDLGIGAADVPARPTFAVAKSEPVIAKDVTIPPPLATLGKQVPDRASLEDPSAEPAGAVIVNRSVNPALGRADFFRTVLPDPFELAAQVKPVVPPAADPGLTPVTVNPMRPR
jgi:hypothetical protein